MGTSQFSRGIMTQATRIYSLTALSSQKMESETNRVSGSELGNRESQNPQKGKPSMQYKNSAPK